MLRCHISQLRGISAKFHFNIFYSPWPPLTVRTIKKFHVSSTFTFCPGATVKPKRFFTPKREIFKEPAHKKISCTIFMPIFLLTYLMTRFIMKCQPRLTFISSVTNPTFIGMRINFFHIMTICQMFLQTARRWQMLLTHWTN